MNTVVTHRTGDPDRLTFEVLERTVLGDLVRQIVDAVGGDGALTLALAPSPMAFLDLMIDQLSAFVESDHGRAIAAFWRSAEMVATDAVGGVMDEVGKPMFVRLAVILDHLNTLFSHVVECGELSDHGRQMLVRDLAELRGFPTNV